MKITIDIPENCELKIVRKTQYDFLKHNERIVKDYFLMD